MSAGAGEAPSKEVRSKPAGFTPLQAIEEGLVPVPGQLTFLQWQHWRKEVEPSSYHQA
jgi:hypothetical protein